MFEPIDMIPMGFDKRKKYRSQSKIGITQTHYSS